ncbi:MAG: helix-turn-helix transcriptional regulator [Bdellovibrionota bacterium]
MKKSKFSTRGHTKMPHTKESNVVLGSKRYRVSQKVLKELQKNLAPQLIPNDNLSFSEMFHESKDSSGSENLRGLRYRENLTQVEFAKTIGITQANLSAMENGKRAIGREIASRLESIFSVNYRLFL